MICPAVNPNISYYRWSFFQFSHSLCMTTCLERVLISTAVAATGANVSLLINALNPLCPKPPLYAEVLANHAVIVVIGYACGFLPGDFLALFDFISANWRTVHATRHAGHLHLLGLIFPMLVVISYASLQGLSGDYKEMMTASIAVALTLYQDASCGPSTS